MSFLSALGDTSSSVRPNYDRMYQALLQYYPQLAQAQNSMAAQNATSAAQAQLAAEKATAAPENDLIESLLATYGPRLAQIGSDIGQQTQQNQANANASVANSAGGQAALEAAINADKAANPEFYSARALESNRLGDLLNSIDLSGNLSGSETRSINQYLGRANDQLGTINTPSAANTVGNAMLYGNAAYQRREQAKSDLSNALSQATSFLPASQSGVGGMNAFNIATGGGNTATTNANASLGLFGGTNGNAASAADKTANTGNLLGTMLGSQPATTYGTQSGSTLGSIVGLSQAFSNTIGGSGSGTSGAMALFCWVAREVYGHDSYDWIKFRRWLLNKAPNWLQRLYSSRGRNFAGWLRLHPWAKCSIKFLMNLAIK